MTRKTNDEAFSRLKPILKDIQLLEDLQAWHFPLLEGEAKWKEENRDKVWCQKK